MPEQRVAQDFPEMLTPSWIGRAYVAVHDYQVVVDELFARPDQLDKGF